MTDSKMMVMVASIERHLEVERRVVYEAICGQNALPVGLAYPSMPANYIHKLNKQSLADADYVILLLGDEYGGLTEKGISYLHAIYVAACALRKPVVSLVFQGQKTKNPDTFDQKRLEGFKSSVKVGVVYYWSDEDSLRDVTERGLEHVMETYPSEGWIKATERPLVKNEKDEKVIKIEKLEVQVSQLKAKIRNIRSLAPVKEISFEDDSRPWVVTYHCNAFREGRLKQFNDTFSLDLLDVFKWLSAALLSPVSESRLRSIVSNRLQPLVLTRVKSKWSGCHAVSDLKVDHKAFDDLKIRLRALDVITFDGQGHWQFTPGGEQMALQKGLKV